MCQLSHLPDWAPHWPWAVGQVRAWATAGLLFLLLATGSNLSKSDLPSDGVLSLSALKPFDGLNPSEDTMMVLQAAHGAACWSLLSPCCPLLSRSLVGITMATPTGPPALLHPAWWWLSLSRSVSLRHQALRPFLLRTLDSGGYRPWCWVGFPRRQTLRP